MRDCFIILVSAAAMAFMVWCVVAYSPKVGMNQCKLMNGALENGICIIDMKNFPRRDALRSEQQQKETKKP